MKKLLLNETGLEISEYAVAAALVAISVAATYTAFGEAIKAGSTSWSVK